jgi:hypothetical protein
VGRVPEHAPIACLVLLLASDRVRNVTGADSAIDGGLIAA